MIASGEFTSQYQKMIFEFIEIKYYEIKKNIDLIYHSSNFKIYFSHMCLARLILALFL